MTLPQPRTSLSQVLHHMHQTTQFFLPMLFQASTIVKCLDSNTFPRCFG